VYKYKRCNIYHTEEKTIGANLWVLGLGKGVFHMTRKTLSQKGRKEQKVGLHQKERKALQNIHAPQCPLKHHFQ